MRNQNRKSRGGLILLVVLSMLTLFSLLSITYVVFSSQARTSSMGMARKDFRGTPHATLLDGALRQVLRGTDSRSAIWKSDLLADLYGSRTLPSPTPLERLQYDLEIQLQARTSLRDNPERTNQLSAGQWLMTATLPPAPAAGTLESVQIFGGSIVKIPLQWNAVLPEQHDVWNSRILTFTSGPLSGLSFRVIRYLGEMSKLAVAPVPPTLIYDHSLQYSIMIDMSELSNRSLASYLTSSFNAYDLLYYTDSFGILQSHSMRLNAGPLNSYGIGVDLDGTVQTVNDAPTIAFLSKLPPNAAPASSPRKVFPLFTTAEPYREIPTSILPNYSYAKLANSSFDPTSDADEPYDAPDFANYALSHVFPSTSPSAANVIPSFHRPAVINYIYSKLVAAKPLTDSTYTPMDLFSTIELMQRACARPLSFTVRNLPMNTPFDAYRDIVTNTNIVRHNPGFSGSNLGEYFAPASDSSQAPELDIDWDEWDNPPVEQLKFKAWVRWLVKGPWDVDNDGNGVTDSNWTDINLPLMTSPEGKLLKMMAAYYIEDLGGRLDINATGNREQTLTTFGSYTVNRRYAYSSTTGSQLPQGNGYGPADISLRPLFPLGAAGDAAYEQFIAERHGAPFGTPAASFGNYGPGANFANDAASALHERHRHNHSSLGFPGLPMSVFGRSGMGIDLFGNPLIYDDGITNEIDDDPYEAHLRSGYRDSLISIAEWERLYRSNDWDRTKLPKRLERLLGSNGLTAINSITPVSSSLNLPRFGGTVLNDRIDPSPLVPLPGGLPTAQRMVRRISSFPELFEALLQDRRSPNATLPPGTQFPPIAPEVPLPFLNDNALAQLLPLEFRMNLPLDPNRPLGNGLDDNGDGLIDEVDEMQGHAIDNDSDGFIDEVDELAGGGHQRAEYPAGTPLAVAEQYGVPHDFNAVNNNIVNSYDLRYESGPRQATPVWTPVQEIQYFNGQQGRQLLARHLYCLAQLILPDTYVFPNISATDWAALGAPAKTAFRAKTLAQWAVNVVDFRDTDAAMTRFPYDVDPFTPAPAPAPAGSYWYPDGGVVWGQEQSELLMTETLAFHDMRIALRHNPGAANRWMQLRVPQGSLFMEFMCTRSPGRSDQHPGIPGGNLYNTTTGALNVAAVSAASPSGIVYPVWRVLLTDPHPAASSVHSSYGSPTTRRSMQYQTATPAGLVWSDSGAPPVPTINRVVWFNGSLVPTASNIALPAVGGMGPARVYRYRSGSADLLGGQYLVVGPRPDTYVGQREQTGPLASQPRHLPSLQRIELQPSWAQMWSDENAPGLWRNTPPTPLPNGEPRPLMADLLQNCVTMEVAANLPTTWTAVAGRNSLIGLNISEPTPDNYYVEPTLRLNSTDNGTDALTGVSGFAVAGMDPDAYVDMSGNPNANSPEDALDSVTTSNPLLTQFGWNMQAGADLRPNVESRSNWSTALLQRLANPELAWNEALNPYVTVDWMPIDLTVFNGESVLDPDVAPSDFHFGSRQKTGVYAPMNPDPQADVTTLLDGDGTSPLGSAVLSVRSGRTFYSYHTEESPVAVATTGGANRPNFRFAMPMELKDDQVGVADTPDFPRLGPLPFNPANVRNLGDFATLGYLNSRYGLRGMNSEPTHATYPGSPVYYDAGIARAPIAPFLPNRDFVNSYELMNVSLSSPGQMMQEFTAQTPAPTAFPFRHTLDFEMAVGANATVTPKSASRLLELIAPRSPWVEAEKVVDPSDLYTATPGTPAQYLSNRALSIYRAPFNRYSSFTDFGRVNVNTASQATVFRGLVSSSMTPANTRDIATLPYQTDFATSLSAPLSTPAPPGTPLPNGNTRLNSGLPTEFAGAMKSGFAVDKACLDPLKTSNSNSLAVSLLRRDAGGRLFATSDLLTVPGGLPNNPYVANSAVSRLVNLTTDQSHVFAVRVTIGYFEYDAATGLGVEYGLEEGKARRHRAFYVIDRSVPVAYQEGQDLNTDNCILMRRIIE